MGTGGRTAEPVLSREAIQEPIWRKINGWMGDRSEEIVEGARLARRAVELGKDDAVALARSGGALCHLLGDLDSSAALIDRALALNPNLAAGWYLGGFVRIYRGEPDDAIERLARAMRLSPLDPEMFRMEAGMAVAHLFAGRFDTASSWAEKAFRDLPSFLIPASIIAASHAPVEWRRRGEQCGVCGSSIQHCASPSSKIGSRSADRTISPCSRKACEEPGCRNDGRVSVESSAPPPSPSRLPAVQSAGVAHDPLRTTQTRFH